MVLTGPQGGRSPVPRPSHPSESLDPGQNGPAGSQRPENPPIAHRGRRQTPPCLHPPGNPVVGCPIPLLPHLHELTTVPSLEASRPPPLILIVALHVCPPRLPGPAPDAALLTWILFSVWGATERTGFG